MRPEFFKAFGVVTLLVNPLLLSFSEGFVSNASLTTDDRIRATTLFVAITIVGFGLVLLRKWAALYFSVPLFLVGLSVALTSIPEISFPWNLIGMAEGVSLMLPLLITIRVWRQLTWGGRWFF